MSELSKIDKNFVVTTNLDKSDIKFYDPTNAPFKIYGVFREDGVYRRMPQEVAITVSEGIATLNNRTAGGRIRFVTDSSYIAIKAEMFDYTRTAHFAYTGTTGFDLYSDNVYYNTFIPPFNIEDEYERVLDFSEKKMREITINMPLYTGVKNVYIGLENTAVVKEASPYKNKKPIVYYGSSITQGGCASRPGMSYQALISRRFNYDYINLGFSGNARGEDTMTNYIKNLDMSCFVLDYDYNAPNVEHLQNTHERMFKAIREANPTLPIIMMSRPKYCIDTIWENRRRVIETTYKNAIAAGDKNVYFIDGRDLAKLCLNEGTVDGVHPNDFGFAAMAETLGEVIKQIKIV